MELDLNRIREARRDGTTQRGIEAATKLLNKQAEEYLASSEYMKQAVKVLEDLSPRLVQAAFEGKTHLDLFYLDSEGIDLDSLRSGGGSNTRNAVGTRDHLKNEPHKFIWDSLTTLGLEPEIIRIYGPDRMRSYYISVKVP